MATATAPTETPAPAEPAAAPKPEPTPAAAPGPLARILTPVEPARPVQPLGSTATMGQSADTATTKGNDSAGKSSPAKGSDRGSPTAALIHAIAARLARGGTAVKRTHTITETRVSGSTSTGQHRTARDAKLADLNNKTQAGRTNHDQKHTTARDARTAATKSGRDHRDARTGDTKTADAKTAKTDTASRGNQDAKTSGSTAATTVTASKPDARTAPSPSTKTADGKTAAPGGAKGGAAGQPGAPATPAAATRPGSTTPAKADPKGLNAKTAAAAKRAGVEPVDLTKDTTASAVRPPAAPEPAAPAADPKLRTRPAREAGYRDGTRAAAVVGQARAYKDGAVDGWDDRTAADKAEQRRMDVARARNAAKPKPKDTPPMKPASGSTIDLAKKAAPAAVPAQVTAVGAKAVEFVADGAAHFMSRGEVRTLKAFERRLGEKRAAMQRVAEGSKATRTMAVELAGRAQRLAEDAKAVKGGERLVRILLRLAERSKALQLRAEEVEKNAGRGAEAVKVLAANAETRHGGIYRAVADSPLTAPAEREFYQDKQGG